MQSDLEISKALALAIGWTMRDMFHWHDQLYINTADYQSLAFDYRDPVIAEVTKCSDWRITDLVEAKRPSTLYLVVPPSDISRTKPLVRLPNAKKDANDQVDPANPFTHFREASWEEALDVAAKGLVKIRDEKGVKAAEAAVEDAEEDEMRGVLIGMGGWGDRKSVV